MTKMLPELSPASNFCQKSNESEWTKTMNAKQNLLDAVQSSYFQRLVLRAQTQGRQSTQIECAVNIYDTAYRHKQ